MNNVAVAIGHDLEFDMVRINDQLLDVDSAIPKSFFGFETRIVKTGEKLRLVMSHTHSSPPAARHGFDHHRVSNFLRDLDRLFFILNYAIASGRNRHASFARA